MVVAEPSEWSLEAHVLNDDSAGLKVHQDRQAGWVPRVSGS